MTSVLEFDRNGASELSEDTLTSRFERQVAAFPDNLAIVTDDISLTYRALDRRANNIAAKLALLPSPYDQPIALFTNDEASRIAAMLGALKANRIFIALASDSPKEWIAQVIKESGTGHIIVDNITRSIVPDGITALDIEQLSKPSAPFVRERTASSEDTAYVIYTSGSTGRPKGVAGGHGRLLRNCEAHNRVGEVERNSRYASLRSSGVSSWIRNSLSPLLAGACLYPFNLQRHGLQTLAPWLIAREITYVNCSASLLRAWLASLGDNVRFPALRFFGVTGERIYSQDVIRLSRHLEGDWRVGHSYASAECGVVAAEVFTPSHLPDDGIVAVGHPVDGVQVSIQDEGGASTRRGEIGEIVVRSRFLAQGYWNDPNLTADAFSTDPSDSAFRTYRTGDLGRWRSDGALEHVGRKGRRIRLRGYSIEPFQVECELMRQPGVTDALVVLDEGVAGQQPLLVGYVVAAERPSPSAIRKGLAERLPSYMLPSYIVVLDKFPLAPTGKVDRNALPPPRRKDARPVEFRTPSDDLEHQLLAIWQEVLKLPQVGVDDDFFELGGTSLQALMIFAEIEVRLGCSLSPTTIVQRSTIARVAEFIRASKGIAASQTIVPLRTSGIGVPLFLVHNKYCFVMYYRHLLSDLKNNRPVYGLQPPPLNGEHRIPRTIEAMAAGYITEIRTMQPRGPYLLAGHSFGGKVCFEIAQQLVRAGERVSFLGLIDTQLRVESNDSWQTISAPTRRIQDLIGKLRWVRHIVLKRWYSLRLELGYSIPHADRPYHYDWLCVRASRAYLPKPYAGHITMFSSAGNSERQKVNWGPLARSGLTIFELPATHDDIVLPPCSRPLAQHFDNCLDRAGVE